MTRAFVVLTLFIALFTNPASAANQHLASCGKQNSCCACCAHPHSSCCDLNQKPTEQNPQAPDRLVAQIPVFDLAPVCHDFDPFLIPHAQFVVSAPKMILLNAGPPLRDLQCIRLV